MTALMLKYAILFVLLPLIYGGLLTGKEEDDVTTFVENVIYCRNVPGMNLAIVKGNKAWTRGFGIADADSKREATNETLFVIGSLGKSFTMALLGMFIQNTRLVITYLIYFNLIVNPYHAEFLKWNNPASICGTFYYHF